MRASSMEWELDVELDSDEIRVLGAGSLTGKMRVNTQEGLIGDRPLELIVGEVNSNQLYAELITEPSGVWIDEVVAYRVILSREGYERLVENGSTGDRMGGNSSCKVNVYLRE